MRENWSTLDNLIALFYDRFKKNKIKQNQFLSYLTNVGIFYFYYARLFQVWSLGVRSEMTRVDESTTS